MGSPTHLTLRDYQRRSGETAIYPGKGTIPGLTYTALGLGEAGEVQGKIKKILRDDHSILTDEKRLKVADELGDLLWYVSQTATELGEKLEDIAERNLQKLADRRERGVLSGSGDER